MITDIVIDAICSGGHHSKISYKADDAPKTLMNVDYDHFFAEDFTQNTELGDLRELLNQHEHTDWLSLKTELEA